jgi:hypothetical protein
MRALTETEHQSVTGGAGAFAFATLSHWSMIGASLRNFRCDKELEPTTPAPFDAEITPIAPDHVNIRREPAAPAWRAMPPMLMELPSTALANPAEMLLEPEADFSVSGGDSGGSGSSSSGDGGCGGACSV